MFFPNRPRTRVVLIAVGLLAVFAARARMQSDVVDPALSNLSTKADKVLSFIPPHQNGSFEGAAGEGVAVDSDGNVYAAEGPISRPAAGGAASTSI